MSTDREVADGRRKATPRRSRKGRPQKNSTPDAREVLIGVTRTLLRTRPPSEINRRDIAELAGVDPALVRYYFGNKDQLLRETAVKMMGEMRQRRRAAQLNQTSFRGKLRAHMRFLIEVLHEYPFLHDLLVGQIAEAGAARARELRQEFIDDPFGEVSEMVDAAVARGEIRPLNIPFFYVAIIGMCSFPVRNPMVLEQVMQAGSLTPEIVGQYAKFAADLLLQGLEPTKPPRVGARAR